MSGKRYSEEFKIQAVKHITEHNYQIGQVSKRLGVTTKSLYPWIKRYSNGPPHILPESPSEMCIYKGSPKSACYSFIVLSSSCTS